MSKKYPERINSIIGLLELFETGKLKLGHDYSMTIGTQNDECKSFYFVNLLDIYYNAKDEIDSIFYFKHHNSTKELYIDKKFFEGENSDNNVFVKFESN